MKTPKYYFIVTAESESAFLRLRQLSTMKALHKWIDTLADNDVEKYTVERVIVWS